MPSTLSPSFYKNICIRAHGHKTTPTNLAIINLMTLQTPSRDCRFQSHRRLRVNAL